jgi:F-type H+-transporting ATPase subunit alpha
VAVEDQIAIIYAGTSGALDNVPVRKVAEFEKAFLEIVHDSFKAVIDELAKTKKLSDQGKSMLDQAAAKTKAQLGL